VVPLGKSIRRLRFSVLEKLVLPVLILPVRALIWTWRVNGPDPTLIDEVAKMPRVIFTIWHGTLLEGLFFSRLWERYHRTWTTLVTPSLDGRFAGEAVSRLGVEPVPLANGRRGVEAAADFIASVNRGRIGVVLADGPRGPGRIAKPGVARTATAARARLVVGGFAPSHAVRLRSWDRFCIPMPFARIAVVCRLLSEPTAEQGYSAETIQAGLEAANDEAARLLLAGRRRGPWRTAPTAP